MKANKIDINIFRWDAFEKTFTAEISDLGSPIGEYHPTGNLVLVVYNPKTNNEVKFILDEKRTVRDKENEIQYYVLTPSKEDVKKFKKLDGVLMYLYND